MEGATQQKHPGGRPGIINKEILSKLRAAFLMDCNEEEACAYAKISTVTLWKYKQRHPEFIKEIQAYRRNPLLKAKSTLYKNLDKPNIALWYLERKAKDEFSTKQIIEDVSQKSEEGDKLDKIADAISSLKQDVTTNPSPKGENPSQPL